jgi:glycerol kinase
MVPEKLAKEIYAIRLLKVGFSAKSVEMVTGIHHVRVRRMKKEYKIRSINLSSSITTGRREAVIWMYKEGYPLDKIAVLVNLRGERILRILKEEGMFKVSNQA